MPKQKTSIVIDSELLEEIDTFCCKDSGLCKKAWRRTKKFSKEYSEKPNRNICCPCNKELKLITPKTGFQAVKNTRRMIKGHHVLSKLIITLQALIILKLSYI